MDFAAFSGPSGEPTQAESRLIEASAQGGTAECADLAEPERLVAGALIAALASGEFHHPRWPGWSLGDGGIQLVDGEVRNPLILARRHLRGTLLFQSCTFGSGINLEGARIEGGVYLGSCLINNLCNLADAVIQGQFVAPGATFANPGGCCLNADRLVSEAWYLQGARFDGSLSAFKARVDGEVYAVDAMFAGAEGQAIYARSMRCAGWTLNRATVRGEFTLFGAELAGRFDASHAEFRNSGGIALFAAEATARGFYLDQVKAEGLLNLRDTQVDGPFFAPGATFDNAPSDAVQADGVQSGNWMLANAIVVGAFSLNGARIAHFNASEATFSHPGGTALWAQNVHAASWFMHGATVRGRLDLAGAVIQGQFGASGAALDNSGNVALWAQRARADGWNLSQATVAGACDLAGAEIATSFGAIGATFTHPGQDALLAPGARIGSWWMDRAVIDGGVNVNGALFEGAFSAVGTTVRNPPGAAIDGQSAVFQHGVVLCNGASVIGDVDFTGATIGQRLDLSGAEFRAGRHRAIRLQEARITGEVTLRQSRLYGHLHANGARIDGRVDFKGALLVAASLARSRGALPEPPAAAVNAADDERQDRYHHHAIVLHEARIDGRLVLPEQCPEGIVDLSRAQCDTLEDDCRGWPAALQQGAAMCDERLCVDGPGAVPIEIQHLVLDGFEYQYFEHPAGRAGHRVDIARARSDWLAGQSVEELKTHFNPQPWLHAAAVLRAMGHDEEAQDLAIARRVRQRLAQSTPRFRRIVSWLLHLVSDYGFNPWKTVQISIVSMLLFALGYWALVHACGGYGVWFGRPGACGDDPPLVAVRHGDVEAEFVGRAYPVFEPIMYSLDAFVPFLDLGSESYWRANTRAYAGRWPVGWAIYVLVVVERFLGAILLAIAITGFTGLLTRDER